MSNEDLVQDLFGGAIRKAFPEATDVQLWGSSIKFNDDDTMTLRCAGKEVTVPCPISPSKEYTAT